MIDCWLLKTNYRTEKEEAAKMNTTDNIYKTFPFDSSQCCLLRYDTIYYISFSYFLLQQQKKAEKNSTDCKGKEIIIKQSRADMPETIHSHSVSISMPSYLHPGYISFRVQNLLTLCYFCVYVWWWRHAEIEDVRCHFDAVSSNFPFFVNAISHFLQQAQPCCFWNEFCVLVLWTLADRNSFLVDKTSACQTTKNQVRLSGRL